MVPSFETMLLPRENWIFARRFYENFGKKANYVALAYCDRTCYTIHGRNEIDYKKACQGFLANFWMRIAIDYIS